jgi:SAM-dependent methyltransferase
MPKELHQSRNSCRLNINYFTSCNACETPISYARFIGRRLSGHQGFFPWSKAGISVSIFKCKSCGLIYCYPQVMPLDLNEFYGKPSDYFSSKEVNDSEVKIPEFISSAPIKTLPKKFLDIGVGHGKVMRCLLSHNVDAYGIEPSAGFYSRLVNELGLPESRIKNESVEQAEYEKESFDFISFGAVLEHLNDPKLALSRAASWLKSNGIIHFEVPSGDWIGARLINTYYKLILSGFTTHLSPLHPPYHLYEFSLDSIHEIAKNCSGGQLTVEKFYYSVYSIPFIPNSISSKIIPLIGSNLGMQLTVFLKKR